MISQFSSEYSELLILTTIIGLAVLVMGRQIFWIFIAGLGFALGLLISTQFYNAQYEWQILLISTLVAVVGAILAYTVQRLAAGIAGLATGWFLTIVLINYLNPNFGQFESLIPYIVGIIVGILLIIFFDWGVIIASSFAGSAIIVSGMSMAGNVEMALLVMFAVIGIAIQAIWFMQEK